MDCCFATSSHNLKQCWLITKCVLRYPPESKLTRGDHEHHPWYVFGDYTFKIVTTSLRGQWHTISGTLRNECAVEALCWVPPKNTQIKNKLSHFIPWSLQIMHIWLITRNRYALKTSLWWSHPRESMGPNPVWTHCNRVYDITMLHQ